MGERVVEFANLGEIRVSDPVEQLARRLFEQQSLGAVSWLEMAEAEREKWRAQAKDCLRALTELGYHIEQPADPGIAKAEAERKATQVKTAINEAERLLHVGEPLLAYNAIQQALADRPGDFRLRQLKGLALARTGALHRAKEELTRLTHEGFEDGETLGLLARTHKDLALAAADSESREQELVAAYELYAAGYRESCESHAVDDAYYTGINAATMAFLRRDLARAREIAVDVEMLCSKALQQSEDDASAYWPQATLAEAALILGDKDVARERYAVAARLAGSRFGDLSSTRHQARLLLEHQGDSTAWLDEAMQMPPVLVYAGHMIDAPGRSRPRFPSELESTVHEGVRARLAELKPVAVYGSAACGADILCLESALEMGSEIHIVLPFPAEQFRKASVDFGAGENWGKRFEQLLDSANEVLVISEQPPLHCNSIYEYANFIMTGLARLRSQVLETRMQGLAVWDGYDGDGQGGTSAVVSMWKSIGVPLVHVDIKAAAVTDAQVPESVASQRDEPIFDYEIKAMLFADAVGYSRLREEQIPLFFEHYIGAVARFNRETDDKAVHVETAGDGMYMVFDDTGTAANYALGLSEKLNRYDWQSLGLPADMNARIGLHCGPVFVGVDPITGGSMYSGIHTSRTARIEPITPPGQVYASSAFAAVSACRDVEGVRFSYIGRTQLAKHYGTLPLYHVKRKETLQC